jgi:hypothetical protein
MELSYIDPQARVLNYCFNFQVIKTIINQLSTPAFVFRLGREGLVREILGASFMATPALNLDGAFGTIDSTVDFDHTPLQGSVHSLPHTEAALFGNAACREVVYIVVGGNNARCAMQQFQEISKVMSMADNI